MEKTLSKQYFKACVIEMIGQLALLGIIIISIHRIIYSINTSDQIIIILLSIVCSFNSLKAFSYKYPESEYEEKVNEDTTTNI